MGRSVLVSIDGPSKSGSTFLGEHVMAEAQFQRDDFARTGLDGADELTRSNGEASAYNDFIRSTLFQHISGVSAGNFFRALTLAHAISELDGQSVTEFRPDRSEDRDVVSELMAIDGIEKVLQTDQHIGTNVSVIARMPGAIDLCETAFSDAVSSVYHRDGGDNLVVADARNPISIFSRRGLLGTGPRQVLEPSIIPVYVDAPAEIAAQWLGGDPVTKAEEILRRRQNDSAREQFPVVVPDNLTRDLGAWAAQFSTPSDSLRAETFHFHNGEGITPDNVQWVGGVVASAAWNLHAALLSGQAAPQPIHS